MERRSKVEDEGEVGPESESGQAVTDYISAKLHSASVEYNCSYSCIYPGAYDLVQSIGLSENLLYTGEAIS